VTFFKAWRRMLLTKCHYLESESSEDIVGLFKGDIMLMLKNVEIVNYKF